MRGAGAVGGFTSNTRWLVSNFGSSFQSILDAGLGVKKVTYEKCIGRILSTYFP